MFDIAKEICAENDIHAKITLIYCSQNAATLKEKYAAGKVKPLSGAPEIDKSVFDECENIVGLAGAKPFIRALEDGADIVICGRATDTAILAVVPLMKAPEKLLDMMNGYVRNKMKKYDLDPTSYSVDFKLYGYNAVAPASEGFAPEEIGLVMIVTAKTQELATRIAKIYNPYLLHFPVQLDAQLPSFALLFSPAEIEKGGVYEFRLHHAVDVDDELELFTIRMEAV